MFLLKEMTGAGAEAAGDAPVPPPEDAPLKDLMAYNYKMMERKLLGSAQERPTNLKLLVNASCFVVASVLMNKFGDSLAI